MLWFKRALAAVLMLVVTACQGGVKEIAADPALDQSNSARLVLYRSNAWVYAMEIPFFYLDDKDIGKLGRGDVIIQHVPVGAHRITARRPIVFVPGQTMAGATVYFEAGKTYYLRFNYQASGMVGTYTMATGDLSEVDEAAYNERR